MRDFGAIFIFHGNAGNNLSAAVVHDMRREVARILSQCGFGDMIENENGGFDNQFAVPSIDEYEAASDELHISYYWSCPFRAGQGDMWRLQSVGVPELHAFAENLNAKLTFQTILV